MFKGNKFNKQYLNLTELTKEILDYDMYTFGETRDGIVNRILSEYMEEADASISLRLQERRLQLYNLCDHVDESTEAYIELLLSQYEKELVTNAEYKEKPVYNRRDDPRYRYVRINDDNAKRIYNTNYCQESEYYDGKAGRYIKAIIEEYARKPFHERERIMLRGSLSRIQSHIDSETKLSLITNGKKYSVRPYKIMLDEQHRYYYLVGFSSVYETEREKKEKRERGEPLEKEHVVSFRIARINEKDIKTVKDHSGHIKYHEREFIKAKLSESGVMFLVGEAETIHLKLTDSGYNKYKTRIYQRPILKPLDEPGLYETVCTPRQIHNYFFDFGEDLEIISPIELREAFLKRYINAAENYQ